VFVRVFVRFVKNYPCDGHSKLAKCTCNVYGHCERGTVETDAWTDVALAMQRRLARDQPLNLIQFLQAHNAYNDRSNGYGADDDVWSRFFRIIQPKLNITIANQEVGEEAGRGGGRR